MNKDKKVVYFVITVVASVILAIGTWYNFKLGNESMRFYTALNGWKCANCDMVHRLSSGFIQKVDEFCSKCGSSSENCTFVMRPKCVNCGTLGSGVYEHCKKCGGMVEAQEELTELPAYSSSTVYFIFAVLYFIGTIYTVALLYIQVMRFSIKDDNTSGGGTGGSEEDDEADEALLDDTLKSVAEGAGT